MLPYHDKRDPWSSHTIIYEWLRKLPKGAEVLDIGAASGTLGRMCQGLDLRLKGIEPNPQWAQMAHPFYSDFFVGQLEEVPAKFLEETDVVVLADVLEHMSDPQTVLTGLVGKQSVDCQFIISVPNIANIWVRLNLLFGHFDYTERGILDRTHLHFYTRSTFLSLIRASGLNVLAMKATPIPLNLTNPFFERNVIGRWLHRILAHLTSWLPTLLGYQFVALTVPDRS